MAHRAGEGADHSCSWSPRGIPGSSLWWAAGYNIVAIPLAAGVLSAKGVLLSPAIGAVFMSVSTVIVAFNAQLLRRTRRNG